MILFLKLVFNVSVVICNDLANIIIFNKRMLPKDVIFSFSVNNIDLIISLVQNVCYHTLDIISISITRKD